MSNLGYHLGEISFSCYNELVSLLWLKKKQGKYLLISFYNCCSPVKTRVPVFIYVDKKVKNWIDLTNSMSRLNCRLLWCFIQYQTYPFFVINIFRYNNRTGRGYVIYDIWMVKPWQCFPFHFLILENWALPMLESQIVFIN